jgi:non-specific serine/threonine protein kinase
MRLRERAGIVEGPKFRAWRELLLSQLCERLGEAGFAAAVAEGRALPLDEAIARALAPAAIDDSGTASIPAHEEHLLTPREREVASLVAQGMTNRQIAETLVITERTAANHVGHILRKLHFHSRAQIASWIASH